MREQKNMKIKNHLAIILTRLPILVFAGCQSASDLARQTKGILVFQRIAKVGFMAGAQYGRGHTVQ